jgi:chromosomal replication initiator protein
MIIVRKLILGYNKKFVICANMVSIKVFKEQLRSFLAESIPEKELEQWYDPLRLKHVNNGSLRVSFPHQLFGEWFNLNFKKIFEEKIQIFTKQNFCPIYDIQSNEEKNESKNNQAEDILFAFDKAKKNRSKNIDPVFQNIFSNNYSFESFIFNKKNQFPIAAATSFAKLESSSPFTVYSGTGCGKTHLLHSIYKDLKTFVPEKNIFFGKLLELETIFNNNTKQGNPFYIPFFGIKIFIIDDFQECARKDDLQKNFINLIEFCLEQKIHLAISIDSAPDKWGFMSAKLRSMLESGLIIELKKPDLEVKIQYIQTQNDLLNLKLKKSDILHLARLYSEFRQIQGILLKILAFKTHNSKDSEFNLEQILKNARISTPYSINPEFIIEKVTEYMGINAEDIKGKKRTKDIIMARHISMYLLRDILALNLNLIGKFMDRDHSSVLYSINKIKDLLVTNKETNKYVTNIKTLCLTKSKNSDSVTYIA